jgi:hypothetical protein
LGNGGLRPVRARQGGDQVRGAGGGHRLPVRVVRGAFNVVLLLVVRRGGPRRRRQLVRVQLSLRDGLPHDAAPDQVRTHVLTDGAGIAAALLPDYRDLILAGVLWCCGLTPRCFYLGVQEGPIQVLRRQVAVVRVAGDGGRPRGPAQASGEAAQDVAELRRRPRGRAPPWPSLRDRQEAGVQGSADAAGARLGAEKAGASAAARTGETGGGREAPVICVGDPAAAYQENRCDMIRLLVCLRLENEMAKRDLATRRV